VNRKKSVIFKHHIFKKSMIRSCILLFFFVLVLSAARPAYLHAATSNDSTQTQDEISNDDSNNTLDFSLTSNAGSANIESTLQILILLTILALAPSILIMVTSFTRIIVVLHFLRMAIGTQTTPPNQVLIGLALFMTLAIMSPVITKVNTQAVQPYQAGKLTQKQAIKKGIAPLKTFMLKQTRDKDLKLFLKINGTDTTKIKNYNDISITSVVPAFIISELRTAFIIGFVIYLPFIVIDMVVASTLMSMGMMMLPPTTISLPFKILLFVLADGWNLIVDQLVRSFT
jgi:flagellar biosynthetic protein FliP